MITLLMLAGLAVHPGQARSASPGNPDLSFAGFGPLAVYRPAGPPSSVALFFSGDGGWNQGVEDMASSLARLGTLVIGVSTPHYLKSLDASGQSCGYFAGDVEQLSQFAQKTLGLEQYHPPLLIGYSSGAGLVYASLAQAPENTFQGAISLGFDPLLPTRVSPCARNGLTSVPVTGSGQRLLLPVAHLPGRWIVLHGTIDRVWPLDSTRTFVEQVEGAQLVVLAQVGHGFGVTQHWLPQLRTAVDQLAPVRAAGAPASGPLTGLPVVELPLPAVQPGDFFVTILSGDGGWASIDKQLADELVKEGIPTVGFNSLQYFWQRRTPETISADLERIIRHYQAAFHRDHVVLVGYSRGADVLPIMANGLPTDLLAQVDLLAFLGLAHETDLEFRMGDWLGARQPAAHKLLPELEQLRGRHMLCVYGARENDTLCPDLPSGLADVVRLDGGHHFDGDYRGLAHLILDHARRARTPG